MEAMRFSTSLFDDAEVLSVHRYGPDQEGLEGTVRHGLFALAGRAFLCIDSPARHAFGSTPSVSLDVQCDSANEIDRLFRQLAEAERS